MAEFAGAMKPMKTVEEGKTPVETACTNLDRIISKLGAVIERTEIRLDPVLSEETMVKSKDDILSERVGSSKIVRSIVDSTDQIERFMDALSDIIGRLEV